MRLIGRFLRQTTVWILGLVTLLPRPELHAEQTAAPPRERLEEVQVRASGLEGNLLGDPSEQPVRVYLPPTYRTNAARRYPVLYLLQGYMGKPSEWTDGYQGMKLDQTMDSLIGAGAREMIVVVPNGRNGYFGSFYLNSPVTGNWEDYLTRDLVSFIDGRYRTLAQAESRGIAGHSMGGYGALSLAMRHPDVYGATYGLSPCCIGLLGDLGATNPAWRKAIGFASGSRPEWCPSFRRR